MVNLCRSYRYRSKGYYVSLIADARGQSAVPTAEGIEGLSEPFGVLRVLHEAGIPTVDASEARARRRMVAQGATKHGGGNGDENGAREEVELLAYFGVCADPRGRAAAQALYREWPTPVLRLHLVEDDEVRHMGPTAQDFRATFGLGQSELSIGTVDADGVALVAAQALERRSTEQAEMLRSQAARIEVANVVDPQYSVACQIEKKYLPQ